MHSYCCSSIYFKLIFRSLKWNVKLRKTNILDTYSFLLLIKVTIFIITNHNIYHAFNQGSKYIKAAHGICVANGYGTTAGRIAYDWYAEFKK